VFLSAGVATWSGLCGLALMYLLRSAQALGAVTAILLLVAVLSTGLAPLKYQLGWLRGVARVNPLTPVLAGGRQGFLGPLTWGQTEPALLALVAVTAVLGVAASFGMRTLSAAR
jgi:ABC-type multidrug transport system permease subunit